jgi:SSS family solute:Na+ symporter
VKAPLLTFGGLDFLVLGLFFIAILALGFSVKLRDHSVLQFLAAGRKLTLPLFVASLVILWYGDILGTGESVATFGIGTWILFGVPYYIFAIIYALFLSDKVRKAEQISIPERLHLRYGKAVALIGAVLLFLLAVPTAHALSIGVLIQSFTGWERWFCVIIGVVVGASFLYKGGLLADARVSLLAFLMMYISFLTIAIWCLAHYPLMETISKIGDKNLLKWDGGTGVLYVISLFIVGAWTLVDPGFHQRVASAESPATSKKGLYISVAFWLFFDLLSITTAMYAIALYPNVQGLDVYPAFSQQILPSGLKALFFCGMLGTAISALVAYALISGATIGREIIARARPGMDDQAVKLWTRIGIGIACLVAIVLAISIDSIVDLWTAWAGAVIGALLIPVCAAYLRNKQLQPTAVFWSIALSFGVAIAWMVYGRTHNDAYLELFFSRTETGLKVVLANSSANAPVQEGTKISIGTLMPGLFVSALVIALGTGISKIRSHA